jgi:hypothetical protein
MPSNVRSRRYGVRRWHETRQHGARWHEAPLPVVQPLEVRVRSREAPQREVRVRWREVPRHEVRQRRLSSRPQRGPRLITRSREQ